MNYRTTVRSVLVQVIGAAMFAGSAALADGLPAQSTESGGVTIAVKPMEVASSAKSWSFEISLSTRGQELRDDLVRTAYIMNRAAKKRDAPLAWTGDAAGGRQRKGILSFKPLTPQPTALELRIQRVGEKAPRVFRWDLNCQCGDPKMHGS
jgi:hypothetical protein